MSNKAQSQEAHTAYNFGGASRPHTECFITHTAHIVHAITNLLCFSSVKHKTVLYDKGSSAV